MKKILAFSDVHIHEWKNHAVFDENGVSNRLKLYVSLAKDIQKIALEKKVDYIIIAGDISQDAIVTPEVANVISIFIETLSNCNCDLILTVGQHDLSVKDNEFHKWNSIISPFIPDKNNVHYFVNEEYKEINGLTFHVCPWTVPTTSNFKKSDIFVGHGVVAGCRNVYDENFTYSSGFSKTDLFDNYKLSIIGDIHHNQIHVDKENKSMVIQPGNLHCNSVKDDPNAGLYYIEFDEEVKAYEFISNYNFEHSDEYYTFRKVKEFSKQVERPFTYEELHRDVIDYGDFKKRDISSDLTVDLYSFFEDLAKNNDFEDLIPLFREAYEEEAGQSFKKVPNEAKLLKLDVKNFMSIKDLSIKFQDVNELLVLGENGAGKSSLFEAIFFCLTGKNTKKLVLEDLFFWGTDEFSISLTIKVRDSIIIIERTRVNSTSNLTLYIDGVHQKRSSISETQEYLYNILGVEEQELFMFSYFSIKNYKSFPSLTDSEKYNVISKLSDTEKIDSIRKNIDTKFKDLREKVSSNKFYLEQIRDVEIPRYTGLINSCSHNSEEINLDEILSEISNHEEEIIKLREFKLKCESESKIILNKKTFVKYLNDDMVSLKKEYLANLEKIKSLNSNICFECGQTYHSKDLEDKKKHYISRNSEISTLAKSKSKELEEAKLFLESSSKIDNDKLIKDTVKIKSLEESILKLKSKISKSNTASATNAKLQSFKDELSRLQLKADEIEKTLSELVDKLEKFKKLQKILVKDGVLSSSLLSRTCKYINNILEDLLKNCKYKAKIVPDAQLSIVVSPNGSNKVDFESLSSGQQKIIEIVFIVALINSYCNIYKLEKGLLGFIFLDEVFSYLDNERLILAKEILDKCYSNKVIITHESGLKNTFNHKLIVTLDDKNSSNYLYV